jgi:hypothetical protein
MTSSTVHVPYPAPGSDRQSYHSAHPGFALNIPPPPPPLLPGFSKSAHAHVA